VDYQHGSRRNFTNDRLKLISGNIKERCVQETGTKENVGTSEGQNITNIQVRDPRCVVSQ
jgi:hypothetical protein